MKWYKHISDSLDDPFIFELMEEFGSDAYVVFFGILEIYSREFSTENGWKLVTKLSYFHKKLLVSSSKVKKILSKIYKWEISFNGEYVSIFIPKFRDLLDEWTLRKLGSKSGVTPEILSADKDTDKELDTDKDLKAGNHLPVDNLQSQPEDETLPPFYQNLKIVIQEINTTYPSPHDQRMAMKFVECNHKNKNPDAVIHCLNSLLKAKANGTEIGNIEAYLKAAMRMENQNYNARDHDRRTEDLKGPPTQRGMQAIGNIMAGMGS